MDNSLRIANSSSELRCFMAETVQASDFKLRRIRLAEQDHWAIKNGALSHFSEGFFHVLGAENRASREQHLVLYQPQSALTGLAMFKQGQDIYVLLQARVEPGLSNIGQYGPTIQSTSANYLQMHGGKSTTYADLFRSFSPVANPLGNTIQSDLGKRYFQKNKTLSYLELSKQIATEANMIWAPLRVLFDVVRSDNLLNPDLRSLLSCFDWDTYIDFGNNGSQPAPEPDLYVPSSRIGKNDWSLVPLNGLAGWEVCEEGIADTSGSGIWIDMFHVSCLSREVQEWSQPLLSCSSPGLVVLLVRQIDDRYEFLVSVEAEFGISGRETVLPSLVIYPGDRTRSPEWALEGSSIIAEMWQDEEGGRFYQNQSLHRVILVSGDVVTEPNQKWVSAAALKSILKSSSRASLQLRCIASLVLDLLNPIASRV